MIAEVDMHGVLMNYTYRWKILGHCIDELSREETDIDELPAIWYIQGESKRTGPYRKKIFKIDVDVIFEKLV